jgi:hypothetical protein
MSLEVPLTLEPMEAEAVDTLPPANSRDGDQVHLQSGPQVERPSRRSKLMLKTPARRA